MKYTKVLFVTSNDMYDKYGNGGTKVSQKNFKLIKEYFGEKNIYLCTFPRNTDSESPKDAITLKRTQSVLGQLIAALFGCKVYFPWREKEVIKLIKDLNIDILFIDGSVLGRLARLKGNYKKIIFYHNIETDYAWNKVKNEGIRFLPSFWASKYNDKCGIKADAVMCLNQRDSDRLNELYNRKADFLLPVTFTDDFDVNRTNDKYKKEILFLGSLFAPNQVSIEWFIKKVMPQLDDITLNIVGKDFEKMKADYEEYKNVHVIGSVKDLAEYYYKYSAVVLPIKYGAGMKVKTAEAMMYGRRIFASDEALEGYDVIGIKGITRCNSAEEYITAINNYFSNEEQLRYQSDVRELFSEKYETSSVKNKFGQFLDMIMDSTS